MLYQYYGLLMPMQSKQISQAYALRHYSGTTVNLFDIKIYSFLILFISSFI